MTAKKFAAIIVLFSLLSSFCAAEEAPEISFKDTLRILRKALAEKDLKTLNRHIALEAIIKAKVKKIASSSTEESLAKRLLGKAANAASALISKAIARITMAQYVKSSPAYIGKYLRNLKIDSVSVKGKSASAWGSFLGKPASLHAEKIKEQWVIVGAESEIIDSEIKNLLNFF